MKIALLLLASSLSALTDTEFQEHLRARGRIDEYIIRIIEENEYRASYNQALYQKDPDWYSRLPVKDKAIVARINVEEATKNPSPAITTRAARFVDEIALGQLDRPELVPFVRALTHSSIPFNRVEAGSLLQKIILEDQNFDAAQALSALEGPQHLLVDGIIQKGPTPTPSLIGTFNALLLNLYTPTGKFPLFEKMYADRLKGEGFAAVAAINAGDLDAAKRVAQEKMSVENLIPFSSQFSNNFLTVERAPVLAILRDEIFPVLDLKDLSPEASATLLRVAPDLPEAKEALRVVGADPSLSPELVRFAIEGISKSSQDSLFQGTDALKLIRLREDASPEEYAADAITALLVARRNLAEPIHSMAMQMFNNVNTTAAAQLDPTDAYRFMIRVIEVGKELPEETLDLYRGIAVRGYLGGERVIFDDSGLTDEFIKRLPRYSYDTELKGPLAAPFLKALTAVNPLKYNQLSADQKAYLTAGLIEAGAPEATAYAKTFRIRDLSAGAVIELARALPGSAWEKAPFADEVKGQLGFIIRNIQGPLQVKAAQAYIKLTPDRIEGLPEQGEEIDYNLEATRGILGAARSERSL